MQATSPSVTALDSLIATLGGALDPSKHSKGPCELLFEKLQAAKCSLLGGMFVEYRFGLEQAIESSECIPGKATRGLARKALRELIADQEALEARRGKHRAAVPEKVGTY